MYRQAISKKKKGAVIASLAIGVFAAAALFIALSFPAGWALFGFCVLFEGLMLFSVLQNRSNIKKMEQTYPGFLERDVDNCNEHIAGKYFFLEKYLVDPFNARMIRYDDISSVKAVSTTDRRRGANSDREGRTVTIKTKSSAPGSMPIIFNDFNSGMASNDREKVEDFTRFMELLRSHVGEDVELKLYEF